MPAPGLAGLWGWWRRSLTSTRPRAAERVRNDSRSRSPSMRPCRPWFRAGRGGTVLRSHPGCRVRHADDTNAPHRRVSETDRPLTASTSVSSSEPNWSGSRCWRTPRPPPGRNSTSRKLPPPRPAASAPTTGPKTLPGEPASPTCHSGASETPRSRCDRRTRTPAPGPGPPTRTGTSTGGRSGRPRTRRLHPSPRPPASNDCSTMPPTQTTPGTPTRGVRSEGPARRQLPRMARMPMAASTTP